MTTQTPAVAGAEAAHPEAAEAARPAAEAAARACTSTWTRR